MSIVPIPGKQFVRDIGTGGRWLFSLFERLRQIAAEQNRQAAFIKKQEGEIQSQAARLLSFG
jgi:hypothetical protein